MVRGNNTGPFGLFIMGIIFIGAGLAIVYFLGKDINFMCSRAADRCIIEETNIFGETELVETLELRKLAGAEVIEKRDSDGDYTYKVMLITNQGRIPLSGMSSSDHRSHRKNAEKINEYVNSYNESLEIEQAGTFGRIFGFVFAGIGGLLLLGSLVPLFKLAVLLFVMLAKRN